jgi:hypothetical protein
MSKLFKLLMAFGLVGVVAACAAQPEEEFVVIEPEPITVEPAMGGKYGGKM